MGNAHGNEVKYICVPSAGVSTSENFVWDAKRPTLTKQMTIVLQRARRRIASLNALSRLKKIND